MECPLSSLAGEIDQIPTSTDVSSEKSFSIIEERALFPPPPPRPTPRRLHQGGGIPMALTINCD